MNIQERQDVVFAIFKAFDAVCRKHGLRYSMEGGTLLGAVKYGGFVPWDDDVDVVMPRADYEQLLQLAPSELGERFFLQSYHNIPRFPLNYAKICYNGTALGNYAYSHIKEMHHGVFIDIFPLDCVRPEKLRRHCRRVGVLTSARVVKLEMSASRSFLKNLVYRCLALLPMKWLNAMVDRQCTRYNKKGTAYLYEIANSNKKFRPLPRRLYEEYTELPFRGVPFMAVKDYDLFLRSRFGEHYAEELPPEEARIPSHGGATFTKTNEV